MEPQHRRKNSEAHRFFRKIATGLTHGQLHSPPRNPVCELLFHGHGSNFWLLSLGMEGWFQSSEREGHLGIVPSNLKRKPKPFTVNLLHAFRLTKRSLIGSLQDTQQSLALHTVSCFLRFQSRHFAFPFSMALHSLLVISNGDLTLLFIFDGTLVQGLFISLANIDSGCPEHPCSLQ